MEFTQSNWNVGQLLTVSLTDAGLAIKTNRSASLSLGVYDPPNSDVHFRGSLARMLVVPIGNANRPPEFNLSQAFLDALNLDEDMGKNALEFDSPVGVAMPVSDPDNALAGLQYILLSGADNFRMAAGGQLLALAGSSFNHERQPSHEVVVVATDGETEESSGSVPGFATVTVTVRINDVDEKPDDYTGHGFASTGQTRNEITLGWSNSEYEAQFDAADRASIVVSFGEAGGYRGTLGLGPDATEARLVGLAPGGSYDVTLHWYSADGLAQDTAAVLGAAAETQANMNNPVLGGLTYNWPENVGSVTTPAGTGVAKISATDADGDEIRYSIGGRSRCGAVRDRCRNRGGAPGGGCAV